MNIKGTTRVCGLTGNPVEHSISPLIHNTAAQLAGLDMVYVPFRVEAGDVRAAIEGAYALNVLGLNVTVPHKQAVLEVLSEVDPIAGKIGAVNTLVRTASGYKGYNTDILGLHRELEEAGISLKDNIVVILGAGGASRAITFLCAREGARKIYLLNRSRERAQELAAEVGKAFSGACVTAGGLEEAGQLAERDYLVLQTTSVGMHPNCNAALVEDPVFYQRAAAGVDIIYNPAKTRFMRHMEENGKPAFNGLKMLLYQALAAFELWHGVRLAAQDVDVIYKRMKEALQIVE